ncbi:MAG: LysR family transcriptional regulator [Albidovulum sp.]|uniref:LysR family transcriptional regulator n=1 Tax=Albidovulum sp. TaxID=1872424 RepID=UPI00132347DC|nr:LysR family transcriptional regulator [Defluviimonas sp.]KAB2886714.1 MAG: LysR family transcriptional regulator [Defluviimonas sp.]
MTATLGIDLVQSFLVLAEQLNFRRSAERLNLDQSALTRRIQKLEHHVGFRLLDRTTREVVLTPAGRAFYEDNAHLMQHYRDTVENARRVAEGKAGVLRVAYMAFAATEQMPRIVSRFRKEHPHVEVKLQYIRTQGQKLALANDEIDLGFMIGPFDHPDFDSALLSSEMLYAVTPLDHPLRRKSTLVPGDFRDQPMILGDVREWAEFRWRLNDMFAAEGVELRPTLEASNTLALIGLVAAGLGVTIYPESLIGYLGRNVAVRPISHPAFRSQTILVWRRKNRSSLLKGFLAAARPEHPDP